MDSSDGSPEPTTAGGEEVASKKRDVRKYYCEFCGTCRSKKALLRSHISSTHQDKVKEMEEKEKEKDDGNKEEKNKCEACNACFKKPAHLKQHMVSHSLEDLKCVKHWIPIRELQNAKWKPFLCPIEDCKLKYLRKDHLNRHLITHQGKTFSCTIEGCKSKFTIKANLKRHLIELHNNNEEGINNEGKEEEKKFVCKELGCGKEFKFASKLKKHEQSHVKLECIEVICYQNGCLKHFSNTKCLKEHIQSSHKYINCDICGQKQLKKNIKRHIKSHENEDYSSPQVLKCTFANCTSTFSNKSNLNKHIKAVHEDCRVYKCRISGCTEKFAYKHVRDNHENTFIHSFCQGDFLETDEVFRNGERGGRKRKCISVELLGRKRIAINPNLDVNPNLEPPETSEYLRWLLNTE